MLPRFCKLQMVAGSGNRFAAINVGMVKCVIPLATGGMKAGAIVVLEGDTSVEVVGTVDQIIAALARCGDGSPPVEHPAT